MPRMAPGGARCWQQPCLPPAVCSEERPTHAPGQAGGSTAGLLSRWASCDGEERKGFWNISRRRRQRARCSLNVHLWLGGEVNGQRESLSELQRSVHIEWGNLLVACLVPCSSHNGQCSSPLHLMPNPSMVPMVPPAAAPCHGLESQWDIWHPAPWHHGAPVSAQVPLQCLVDPSLVPAFATAFP